MHADNSRHLHAATKRRQDATRDRADAALQRLHTDGQPLSIAGLARAAGVTRSWIYTQPDLLTALRSTPAAHPTPTQLPRTYASEDSWKRRLELAHARIRELNAEVQTLRNQLARTHGQLRAQRTLGSASTTVSSTQAPS